jgi:hypothetical protein
MSRQQNFITAGDEYNHARAYPGIHTQITSRTAQRPLGKMTLHFSTAVPAETVTFYPVQQLHRFPNWQEVGKGAGHQDLPGLAQLALQPGDVIVGIQRHGIAGNIGRCINQDGRTQARLEFRSKIQWPHISGSSHQQITTLKQDQAGRRGDILERKNTGQ